MDDLQQKPKLHFEQLLLKLHQSIQQEKVPEKMEYYNLLAEMTDHYNLSVEELKLCGFRKAYRRAVEGL